MIPLLELENFSGSGVTRVFHHNPKMD